MLSDLVVTSMTAGFNKTGNLLVTEDHASLISHDTLSPAPNGTGDMLTALFLGTIVQGNAAQKSLVKASATVFSAIKHANHLHKSSLSPEHLRDVMSKEFADIRIDNI